MSSSRLAALALTMLALFAVMLAVSAPPAQAATQDGAPKIEHTQRWFRHENHVDETWNKDTEQARDCQGCHDYRKDVPESKRERPVDRCVRCHDPDGLLGEALGLDKTKAKVDPRRESEGIFKHSSHVGAGVRCAMCHHDVDANGQSRIVMPKDNPQTIAYCASCHEKPEHREAFNEGLTLGAKKNAAEQKPFPVFRHDTHLKPDELAGKDPARCLECHASMRNARPDSLAEQQFDTQACQRCHLGMEFRVALERDGQRVLETSAVAGLFDHEPHLAGRTSGTKATAAAYAELGEQACRRCHVFDARTAGGVPTFRLAPAFLAKDAHAACAQCHTQWAAPNHGNTDRCSKCHTVEHDSMTSSRARMAENRPRDEVRRADAERFAFTTQSHVLIHGERTSDSRACNECHKAKLEKQPSRIGSKPFDHATHLPREKRTSDQCRACHFGSAVPSSLADARMASTAFGEGTATLSYDPGSCVRCHGRDAAAAEFAPALRTRVLRFDHLAHLSCDNPAAGGKRMECVHCHDLAAPGEAASITLHDKIADCTLCHGHDEVAGKVEPKENRALIQGCVTCHKIGVPAKGQTVEVARAALALDVESFQEHDGVAACSSCHVRISDPPAPVASAEPERPSDISIIWGPGQTPHKARAQAEAKAKKPGDTAHQYFMNEAACLDCHWRDQSAQTDYYQVWSQRAKLTLSTNARLTKFAQYQLRGDNYRREFGAWLSEDYPGGYPGLARER